MMKYNLRELSYTPIEKLTPNSVINSIWAVCTICLIIITNILIYKILDRSGNLSQMDSNAVRNRAAILFSKETYAILIFVTMFVYLALKFFITVLFSSDKNKNVKMKMLKDPVFPVCFCREVFKIWQVIAIYFIPVFFTYSTLFILSFSMADAGIILILSLMLFVMSFDLALIAKIIYLKVIYNPDYIAVNNHAYDLTIYKSLLKK